MADRNQRQTGFADVNGTRLYYEMAGEGHPLVLVHGGMVNRHLWDDQFDVFAEHYKVIRYDVRGYGESALLKGDTEPHSLHDDLYALLQYLEVEKTYLLGLSMGGELVVNFTLEHPHMVDALIPVAAGLGGFDFIANSPESKEEVEKVQQAFHEATEQNNIPLMVEITLRIWTDGPFRSKEQMNPEVRERVRVMTDYNYRRGDDEGPSVEPVPLEPPAITRLSQISVPTLIIVGDHDVPPILAIADILEKEIRGAKKVVIPGTAHHLNMEKPEEFNRIVLDFLGALQ